ncbi:MAG: type II toxin-antitoxin system RelE/ParE family toxin [Clostridia bacterium]|nr:type II toxin-antitoxin system RelE/ParE family toxin [Clostridia bacterium]
MRNIYIYKNENQVARFFENADEKLKQKFKRIITYISNEKNPLCEPYVKHISVSKYRELYEIRMKVCGNMARVLFVRQDEDIVLLYAFYKKSGKDTEKALEAAFKMLNKMRENSRRQGRLNYKC